MLAYEGIVVLRQIFRLRTGGKLFWDLLFFVSGGIVVFRMVFLCNEGTLRSFFWLAFAGGALLYHKAFGNLLSHGIVKALRWLTNLLIGPWVWICKKITKKVKKSSKKP